MPTSVPAGVAKQIALTAHPNPFNPRVTLSFTLPQPGHASLEIFSLDGSRVRQLASGFYAAGNRSFSWDGRTDTGNDAASGIYFAKLGMAEGEANQRLILLR